MHVAYSYTSIILSVTHSFSYTLTRWYWRWNTATKSHTTCGGTLGKPLTGGLHVHLWCHHQMKIATHATETFSLNSPTLPYIPWKLPVINPRVSHTISWSGRGKKSSERKLIERSKGRVTTSNIHTTWNKTVFYISEIGYFSRKRNFKNPNRKKKHGNSNKQATQHQQEKCRYRYLHLLVRVRVRGAGRVGEDRSACKRGIAKWPCCNETITTMMTYTYTAAIDRPGKSNSRRFAFAQTNTNCCWAALLMQRVW